MASGVAAPLAAEQYNGMLPAASSWPDVNSWQYRDLWLNSEAQQRDGLLSPDALAAQLNSFALSPARQPTSVTSSVPGGLSPSSMLRSSYQTGPPRRGSLEINHNKAITKKLASAVHYQQVS